MGVRGGAFEFSRCEHDAATTSAAMAVATPTMSDEARTATVFTLLTPCVGLSEARVATLLRQLESPHKSPCNPCTGKYSPPCLRRTPARLVPNWPREGPWPPRLDPVCSSRIGPRRWR